MPQFSRSARSSTLLMMSRRLAQILTVAATALLLSLAAWAPTAQADASGSPAGPTAAGAYLDLGSAHGCGLQRDRQVRCWGKGSSGRLGGGQLDDRLAAPGTAATQLAPGLVAAVSGGDAHTCALLVDGAVRCWGQGGSGQLGSGQRDNRLDGAAAQATGTDDASTVALGGPATSISAGGDFTCAVVAGAVRCWGDGAAGALGTRGVDHRLDGLTDGPTDEASVVPLGPAAATAVSAGAQHACALLEGGVVRCWGNGGQGRLGSGGTDDRLDGVAGPAGDEASVVALPEPATAISAGGTHSCALLASGDVACWGDAFYGQIGAGRNDARLDGVVSGAGAAATDAAAIVTLKPATTVQSKFAAAAKIPAVAVAAGDAFTCAITSGGEVRCWGKGDFGQLGHGALDHRLEAASNQVADAATLVGGGPAPSDPARLGPGLGAPAVAITAGYGAACATLATGAVRCWGNGGDGRLGSGAVDNRLDGAVAPETGTDAASVVPIGPLPGSLADLPSPAAPDAPATPSASTGAAPAPVATPGTPGPGPPAGTAKPGAAVPELSFKTALKGRTVSVAALMQPSKAGTCPTRVSIKVLVGRKTVGKDSAKVTKKGAHCRIAGTVKLRTTPKKSAAITVSLSAKGVVARTLTVARK